jgi:SAM-dependent methyltransferase
VATPCAAADGVNLQEAMVQLYQKIAEEDVKSPIQSESELLRKAERDLSNLGCVSGLTVLEVGPGLGHLTRLLEERGALVSVVDLVSTYVDRLEQSISGTVIVQDAQQLQLKEHFDLVICCDVLEHVLRPADVLLSIAKILKPEGRLYVRVPSNERLVGYSQLLGCPYEAVHLRTYSPRLLEQELISCGYRVLRGPKGLKGSPRVPRNNVLFGPWFWRGMNECTKNAHYGELVNPPWLLKVLDAMASGRIHRDRRAMGLIFRALSLVCGSPLEVWTISRPAR